MEFPTRPPPTMSVPMPPAMAAAADVLRVLVAGREAVSPDRDAGALGQSADAVDDSAGLELALPEAELVQDLVGQGVAPSVVVGQKGVVGKGVREEELPRRGRCGLRGAEKRGDERDERDGNRLRVHV